MSHPGDDSALRQRAARACEELGARENVSREIAAVLSPYRVCPLGAHIDHQHGPVLGTAIGLGTVLAFAPTNEPRLRLESDDFAGGLDLGFDDKAPAEGWGRYAWAAARILRDRLPAAPRGIVGRLGGDLPGGGLSSSASVLVAYLLALAEVNGLELAPAERVALARQAENEFVGVRCGVLDPASIVGSKAGCLLEIDTREVTWRAIAPGSDIGAVRFLVVFTGQSRMLSSTPFNARVGECESAASRIAAAHGQPPGARLGDLPEDWLSEGLDALPHPEGARARHFFEERRRVRSGIAAWQAGDFADFGSLMWDSCRSSIENYETGSEEQFTLQEILRETPGVLGARFSGAGFGGCNVALVEASRAEAAREEVLSAYRAAVPRLAEAARAIVVSSGEGARVVGAP